MSRNVGLAIIALIVGVAAWLYWRNSQNPTGGGTAALNSAVQSDLAYYQAWQDAQSQQTNPPSPNPPGTPGGGPVKQNTVQSQAMTLPVGV